MRLMWCSAIALAVLAVGAKADDIEKTAGLNGSQYTVIAPVYDGSSGSESFIRFFNANTATSTFDVTVMNASTGVIAGSINIQVPPNASLQYPLTSSGGTNSIFALAGITDVAGTSYALYLQNSNQLSGFAHVTFNGTTTLFENHSACSTTLNQQLANANSSKALINVHTSDLAGYPSIVSLANFAGTSTTVTLSVFDAGTGNSLGQLNETVPANQTMTLPESQIEAGIGFTPTSAQPHINIIFTNAAGGSLPMLTTQAIHNATLGGDISMTAACSVNAVP